MGTLSSRVRSNLPAKDFALPGSRKYPVPDAGHAANAKARAAQMEKKGKLSAAAKARIIAKANKVLKHG